MLLLAVLGVLLARTTPRQGRYAKLFMAILVYIIYMNLMTVARAWVEHSVAPPGLGMWWVHGVVLAVIAVLLGRQMGVTIPLSIPRLAPKG